MENTPGFLARLYDFGWGLLTYWWLLVPGGLFAIQPLIETYLPESWWKTAPEKRISHETRRRLFRWASLIALFIASFLVYDDQSRALHGEIRRITAERNQALLQRDANVSPAIDRLSGDLISARTEIGRQDVEIARQKTQLAEQKEEINAIERRREYDSRIRHLSASETQHLNEVFTPVANDFPELKIGALFNNEAQSYAREFAVVFDKIGIKVKVIVGLFPQQYDSPGVQILVKDIRRPPVKASLFHTYLFAAGIKTTLGTLGNLSADEFMLAIGTKPPMPPDRSPQDKASRVSPDRAN